MLKIDDKFVYEPTINKSRYMLWQYISGSEILKKEPLLWVSIDDVDDFKNTQFKVSGINYKHKNLYFWRKKYDLDIQSYVLKVIGKIPKKHKKRIITIVATYDLECEDLTDSGCALTPCDVVEKMVQEDMEFDFAQDEGFEDIEVTCRDVEV